MQEFNATTHRIETASSQVALSAASETGAAKPQAAYIGLDVHKETIAVAVAEPGRGAIADTRLKAVDGDLHDRLKTLIGDVADDLDLDAQLSPEDK